jgi:hypothetical protein
VPLLPLMLLLLLQRQPAALLLLLPLALTAPWVCWSMC